MERLQLMVKHIFFEIEPFYYSFPQNNLFNLNLETAF